MINASLLSRFTLVEHYNRMWINVFNCIGRGGCVRIARELDGDATQLVSLDGTYKHANLLHIG